jgi:hypothetical protein
MNIRAKSITPAEACHGQNSFSFVYHIVALTKEPNMFLSSLALKFAFKMKKHKTKNSPASNKARLLYAVLPMLLIP